MNDIDQNRRTPVVDRDNRELGEVDLCLTPLAPTVKCRQGGAHPLLSAPENCEVN